MLAVPLLLGTTDTLNQCAGCGPTIQVRKYQANIKQMDYDKYKTSINLRMGCKSYNVVVTTVSRYRAHSDYRTRIGARVRVSGFTLNSEV
ncbi:hypothetical protein Vid5_gp27 [Pantoea phage vB_PagS_Vid5]|uniref:Uncharacterized protein n=1 Tax=Pantoea phage vB_PagS_Vid5 TaxID=2099652 RepID=A0A2P1CKR4_9CAUD|nr:hypothetical protein FDJ45_gp027 [Pantoea phage vB_PagS_Vid5]AVJ51782.1 hypothetical protein Vid5_gp27 [Pantoea phage vB_PagS_Vid5]